MNTLVTYAKLANAITTRIIVIVSSTLGAVGVGSAAHNSSQLYIQYVCIKVRFVGCRRRRRRRESL